MRCRQTGFSLLEAIVAMVLIAVAGMAMFTWINASFDSINRIDAANARATAQMNALEWIKTINPLERPKGSERIGTLSIEWEARELAPPTAMVNEEGEKGRFNVALYEVVVTVEVLPDVPQFRFVVRQMGYLRAGGDDGLFDEPQPVKRNRK